MPPSVKRRAGAVLVSLLVPGAGQLALGARRRGALLLCGFAVVALATVALVLRSETNVDRRAIAAALALNVALFVLRAYAVADVARPRGASMRAALVVLLVVVAGSHVAAGYVTVRSYATLETVFASGEPGDVLPARGVFLVAEKPTLETLPASPPTVAPPDWPDEEKPLARGVEVVTGEDDERPWTTIVLLGTDEGPGNWGARTDTIILAALQHGTGRAAAFGIPRNLTDLPLGGGRRFREPLNALYGSRGGGAAGASALKQAVSRLLGIRVDYYALVNLRGFADLVDALGGVRILVKERLVDSVTRPAWGEPKPRIEVRPGEVRRFYGREALAYVRSRKDSSDYARMARQRCFLSAMADQLDPVRVLRSFGRLASIVERNVSTDVPLDRLPRLVRLVGAVEPERTLTVTFGVDYFFGRRARDNHPVPNGSKIRRTVRRALLEPERLGRSGGAAVASTAC